MTSSNQLHLSSRRVFLQNAGLFTTAVALGCAGETEYLFNELSQQDVWTQRASKLEARGVYTEAEPGKWADKVKTHTPQIVIDNGILYVLVDHVTEPAHWSAVD